MKHRDSSPTRPGAWAKHEGSDNDIHDDDLEEASSRSPFLSVLRPADEHRRRRSATTTPSYALLAFVALASHLRAAYPPAAAHRNDNTLASPSHDPDSPRVRFLHPAPCGATPSEARAAGCLFDLVSFNWLPPPCHDAELAAQFEAELRAAGELAWYEDERRTRPLSRDQVVAGDRSGIHVSPAYHLRHCTAMWRRMHRALMQGGGGLGRLDGYIWSYHHTRHCEETLLAGGERNGSAATGGELFTTEVRIKYPDCGVVLEGGIGSP